MSIFSITSDTLLAAIEGTLYTLEFRTIASLFAYRTLLFIIPLTCCFFIVYKKHIKLHKLLFIPIYFVVTALVLSPASVLLFFKSLIYSTLGTYYTSYKDILAANLLSAYFITVIFYTATAVILAMLSTVFSLRPIRRITYRFRHGLSHLIMPTDDDLDISCEVNKAFLSEDIRKRAEHDIAQGNIGGASVLVKQNGKVMYKGCFGNASEDSVYRIASMTKPVTAAAILILVSRGQLGLDDPIEKYLPQFADMDIVSLDENGNIVSNVKAETKVTVRSLLTHTSGIGCGEVWERQSAQMTDDVKASLRDSVDFYAKSGLAFEPSTSQLYSATAAFDILALMIESITGMDYNDFLREEIFEPCEMTNTTFVPLDEQWEKLIEMHDKVDGCSCTGSTIDGCVFEDYPCTHYLGGAGLISTVEDYSNFAQMLLNKGRTAKKQLVPSELIDEMTKANVPESVMPGSCQWGLGVRVITGEDYKLLPVNSFGWSGAYGTHFFVDPENRITAVYMKNSRYDGGSDAVTGKNFELDVHNSLIRI